MILPVILARGGSKRLPRKNLRPLSGKPLIVWTIEAALAAERLSHPPVVSSDDLEILYTAALHAALPLHRPAELASDTACSYAALLHASATCGLPHTHICLLQPTSPLRTAQDIDSCVALALDTGRPVISVEAGWRQANGAVYVGEVEWLRAGNRFDCDGTRPVRYEMPAERSIDIDTIEDFRAAEDIVTAASSAVSAAAAHSRSR